MSSKGLLILIIFFIIIKNSTGNWGGWGHNGFHSGYNNHNGYGYGSDVCAGARRHQGMGGHHQQQYQTGYNNINNYGGYYQQQYPNSIEYYSNFPVKSPTTTTTTTTPAPLFCNPPYERDAEVFFQYCIFPDEQAQSSCYSRKITTGTTVITSCRAPKFYNKNGDVMLEICKDGMWYSDGKPLACESSKRKPHTTAAPVHEPYVPVSQPNYHHQQTNWTNSDYHEPSKLHFPDPVVAPSTPEPSNNHYPFWYFTTTPSTTTTSSTTTTTVPSTTSTTSTTTSTTTERPYYQIDWRTHESGFSNNHQVTPKPSNKDVHFSPVKCPPLPLKEGIILECHTKTERSSGSGYIMTVTECQEPQPVDAEATYRCQMYYEPIGGVPTQYRKCKSSGEWTGNEQDYGCKLECGKSNPVGHLPLITFGEMTTVGQYPWHAALFIKEDRGDQMVNACGGTLISARAVLTASHCMTLFMSLTLRELSDFRVDLGRYSLTKDDIYVQKFEIEKIIKHPAYNPLIFESDIAIIILKGKAKIGFHVRPACYPKAQNGAFDEFDGSYATIVGWGRDENEKQPTELRSGKLKVISHKECIDSFEGSDTGMLVAKSTTFCATNNNGTNVCRGDSGGGAYFSVKTSTGATKWFLQGLVSLGINGSEDTKKCDPRKVSIFTRISPYADWIVRVLSENDAL